MTWFILIVNALFLIWIIGGIHSTSDNCAGQVGQQLKVCKAATGAGTAIGVAFIVFLWVAADVILGVVFLVTNRRDG